MTKTRITPQEWEVFRDWECELRGPLQAFEANFWTDSEIERIALPEPAPLDDETEAQLLDEAEAWEEMRKEELLALADKIGCTIYLAAYLRYLNEKLELVADVFGNKKVVMQETPAPASRTKKNA